MGLVYLNGAWVDAAEARVSVDDRGFLLSDGVYEVTPAYRGRFFLLDRHLARLRSGLAALRIDADLEGIEDVHERLLADNGLLDAEMAYVYVQITRGVAPRSHAFPAAAVHPTVYACARVHERPSREVWERGFEAVTVADRRWARVDVKTISLLPNVLAQQAAVERGATDALLVRNGVALEGAHNNFFAVFGEQIVTHPTSNVILPGITRAHVIALAREMGFEVVERAIQVEELAHADEAFFTGSTTEVRPTVRIDGRPVGKGLTGLVTRRLFDAFLDDADPSRGDAAERAQA